MHISIPLPLGKVARDMLIKTAVTIINTADRNLQPNFNTVHQDQDYIKIFKWTETEQMSTCMRLAINDDNIVLEILGHHLETVLAIMLNNVQSGILPKQTNCYDLSEE